MYWTPRRLYTGTDPYPVNERVERGNICVLQHKHPFQGDNSQHTTIREGVYNVY